MNTGDISGQLIYDLPDPYYNVARYMWSIFMEATHLDLNDHPEVRFTIHRGGVFPISRSFDDMLKGNIQKVACRYFLPEGLTAFRKEEPVACAFYLLNGLHETLLPPDKLDKYGRYPYHASIQHVHNLMEVNYVQDIFDDLYKKMIGRLPDRKDSQLMWTHDIDYLYSAWKVALLLAWQRRKFKHIPKIIIKTLISPHQWDNVKQILNLENEFGIRSIFFWLTEQGKAYESESDYIDHADYSFRMKKIRQLWEEVKIAGFCNGLHKSAYKKSFDLELNKLPEKAMINRNHFLKFNIPDHYDRIEKSGLRYDASLGFPEHHGFRNSFGRPFQPYNLKNNRPYQFKEYPLHLMDTTFLTYMKFDLEAAQNKMKDFIYRHRHSCVISLLLHNSHYNFGSKKDIKDWKNFYQSVKDYKDYIPQAL